MWGSRHSHTANPTTWRPAPRQFSPELPVAFSPFWLLPLPPPPPLPWGTQGRLGVPLTPGEVKHEQLPQEGMRVPCQDPPGTSIAWQLTLYCFTWLRKQQFSPFSVASLLAQELLISRDTPGAKQQSPVGAAQPPALR